MEPHTVAAGHAALLHTIEKTPIIDQHAHPLLRSEAIGKHPLLSIATEAHGDALESSRTGLPHLRAVRQLSKVLECEATWEEVERAIKQRRAEDYQKWIARCLSGIECVLVDDGLDNADDALPYNYFSKLTPSASKRIVRIEPIAQRLIEQSYNNSVDAFELVSLDFSREIMHAMLDKNVVGFKSVICYRTGLAIPATYDITEVRTTFDEICRLRNSPGAAAFTRLSHEGLNEYFVHLLAQTIRKFPVHHRKPIQFHTGLGDNDITLTKSSPSHLQEFIRAYPEVPIVLLHSGYPFVRESAYLAAMYANVYSDVGEVFPFLSRDGQEAVVRQTLELCPASKILWSTDGHWFPETYLLAVIQVREALGTVLADFVRKGDLTWQQAIRLVEDVFFHNSNKLYGLGLAFNESKVNGQVVPFAGKTDAHILSDFLQDKEKPRYLSVWWNDLTAAPRMRSIPIRRVWSMLNSGQELSFGLAKAYTGLLLHEVLVSGATATGENRLHPDLSTLRPGPRKGHIVAMSNLREQDGSPADLCPRSLLQKTLDTASRQGLAFELGFEMELVFVRCPSGSLRFEPIGNLGHNASSVRAFEHEEIMAVIDEAIDQLDAGGVYVEMVHAESAPGQFEIILPKAPTLEAVEALLYARDIISACAAAKGYRVTLHPKPLANGCGTAAHVHMSISSAGGSDPKIYEPFYAGILKHLRAINAFTYSNMASYERVQDSCWAGGTWVTWGSQNREAPLRKIEGSHWEMKCMDGLANPYLAMSAVLAAGIDGVVNKEKLIWGDCPDDPALLSDTERGRLGVVARLPRNLPEALDALNQDSDMCEWLGRNLIERYVAIKNAETEFLGEMGESARRTWIMHRF